MSKIGGVLMLLGLLAFAGATFWWIAFFYDILGENFQIARECFYWTSDLCSLGASAAIFADVPEYEPKSLWFAAALFFVGLLLRIPGR